MQAMNPIVSGDGTLTSITVLFKPPDPLSRQPFCGHVPPSATPGHLQLHNYVFGEESVGFSVEGPGGGHAQGIWLFLWDLEVLKGLIYCNLCACYGGKACVERSGW